MELEISYNSFLIRKFTEKTSEKISLKDNSKISDLIEFLVTKYSTKLLEQIFNGKTGELKVLILINGLISGGLETPLANNDVIRILPFITGG